MHRVLAVIQEFSGASAQRSGPGVLMVVTRGAVAVASETVTDLAGSAVWGLVRSAQTEDPERIILIDVDTDEDLSSPTIAEVVSTATAIGEPQIAIRNGITHTPRLTRLPATEPTTTGPTTTGPTTTEPDRNRHW